MIGALVLFVAVLMSGSALGSHEGAQNPPANICKGAAAPESAGIAVEVDADSKKASFVCDSEAKNLSPPEKGGKVTQCHKNNALNNMVTLAELFGDGSEATVTPVADSAQGSAVTLTLASLPETAQTIYFGCTGETESSVSPPAARVKQSTDGAGKKCTVTVIVPADPAANTCTLKKKFMDLKITSETKTVSFQCDTGIPTLSPAADTQIFDDKCEEQVTLSDVIPSAKMARRGSRYSFSVEELPETEVTLCYKCSTSAPAGSDRKEVSENNANACVVKIKVSAANLDSAASTTGVAGSLLGLVFRLGVSVFFVQLFF
ncbi:SAG-related sequence SRS53C [Toxoplasma gondii MAS]|uniref:SAG-related sequence SRS53C n=1 Tax=Toxoplasma gondii MAS TaxID=943118 RepID=A0A086R0F9_TOXGO|nr:SAG-related sequence SRS53C [Toxoplasma gondii MAS]